MLICGPQSIVDVVTADLIPAEEGPRCAVEFTVHVETYGFVATRRVFIEQSDARTFVSHLRAIEQVRQAAVTLAATPPEDFQLTIGFIGQTGRATVSGRLAATSAGERAPALEFGFEFDAGTLPTIVAECERWIAPPRPSYYLCTIFELMDGMDDARATEQFTLLGSILDKLGYLLTSGPGTHIDQLWAIKKDERDPDAPHSNAVRAESAGAFERQFLAWTHIRLGVLPKPKPGETGQWTFEYHDGIVNFSIVDEDGWMLRVDENEPYAFLEQVDPHFQPGSAVRRRMADGRIRAQYTSSALFQPFIDQTDMT